MQFSRVHVVSPNRLIEKFEKVDVLKDWQFVIILFNILSLNLFIFQRKLLYILGKNPIHGMKMYWNEMYLTNE